MPDERCTEHPCPSGSADHNFYRLDVKFPGLWSMEVIFQCDSERKIYQIMGQIKQTGCFL
jgi:hypothetical protein